MLVRRGKIVQMGMCTGIPMRYDSLISSLPCKETQLPCKLLYFICWGCHTLTPPAIYAPAYNTSLVSSRRVMERALMGALSPCFMHLPIEERGKETSYQQKKNSTTLCLLYPSFKIFTYTVVTSKVIHRFDVTRCHYE